MHDEVDGPRLCGWPMELKIALFVISGSILDMSLVYFPVVLADMQFSFEIFVQVTTSWFVLILSFFSGAFLPTSHPCLVCFLEHAKVMIYYVSLFFP